VREKAEHLVLINEISTQYIKTFDANLIQLVQQKTSKLRRTVNGTATGTSAHSFRVMSPRSGAMSTKTGGTNASKRTATPYADSVFNDRVAIPSAKHTADSYEWDDVIKMLTNPESALTTSMASQVGRTFDDIIIAAATATAVDSLGTSGLTLPAAQQIGGATTAPDFALVKKVRREVLRKDIDADEEIFFVVSPDFITALMDETKYGSRDYVNAQALIDGKAVERWMGFTWIMSNRLTTPVAGPPAQRYALAYTKDAIGLLTTKEPFTEVAKDPGQSFSTTVYTAFEAGAVRVQDDKMFRVHYLENA
jgi:hypothetical protein